MNTGMRYSFGRLKEEPLFTNAVANYKFNETSGPAIEQINGYQGMLNGTIIRDGEFYDFTTSSFVSVPSNNDFNFTDNDFVIKTEIIFNGSQSFPRIITKDTLNSEYEIFLIRSNGTFGMRTFFEDGTTNLLNSASNEISNNVKHIIGFTRIGLDFYCFIDGRISSFKENYFTKKIKNTNDEIKIGVSVSGKIKETLFIKGSGWNEDQILRNYNSGNGTII